MTLQDRVLYRALVSIISEALPERLRTRVPIDEFRRAPLDIPEVEYITQTDVTAYYEFVDHDLLAAELIAQTGEEPAIDGLMDLLLSIHGRRVGLPQVHPISDVLGDTYIDQVRRRLVRRGFVAATYSDDFRISSSSLGEARAALEVCATEVRAIGLVLNERKTFTYGRDKYRTSLDAFADAEKRLFIESTPGIADEVLLFLAMDYGDDSALTLGGLPVHGSVEEDETIVSEGESDEDLTDGDDSRRMEAGRRAWLVWAAEGRGDDSHVGREAAVVQSLLGRALPLLGMAGDEGPLNSLSELLRSEPSLTPQIASYLSNYSRHGRRARTGVRRALDDAVGSNILSPWQGIWLAQTAGLLRRASRRHDYEDWLVRCASGGHEGLAATAAAALGQIGRDLDGVIELTIDRVGPEWRRLAFWGLATADSVKAAEIADDEMDRLILTVASST